MAAQDIQIRRRMAAPALMAPAGDPVPAPNGDERRKAVVLGELRRRWRFYLLMAVLSAGIAYVVCTEFRTFSSESEATLLYTSLPNPPGPLVYTPLSTSTYAEMIRSYPVLERVRNRARLNMPLKDLVERVEARASESSNLLLVRLQWNDLEEGVSLLNMLLEEFTAEATELRRASFRNHIQHVEAALQESLGNVDKVQQQLDELRLQRERRHQEHNLAEDRYQRVLHNIVGLQSSIAAAEGKKEAAVQQIGALDNQMIAESGQTVQFATQRLQEEVLREAMFFLETVREPHAESSRAYRRLTDGLTRLAQYGRDYVANTADTADVQVDRWYKDLVRLLAESDLALPVTYYTSLEQAYQRAYAVTVQKLTQVDSQQRQLVSQRQKLELSLIELDREVAGSKRQLAAYEAEAKELHELVMDVESDMLSAEQQQLEEAVTRKEGLVAQLGNTRQLEQANTPEWTVVMPATAEAAELTSNRKLLFALSFGLCMMVFSGPFLLLTTLREESSQVAFAQSLHLPILAERVLEDFLPDQRGQVPTLSQLGEDHSETLRMLALRLQQSIHQPGAVILFSSFDTRTSALPLIEALGQCLADREERVLVVDAVSPDRLPLQVLDLTGGASNGHKESREPAPAGTEIAVSNPGLAEYLSQEHRDVEALIRPTGYPGVDFVASGRKAFPREAMASSYLTTLLDTWRKDYTMVLVRGPSARHAADVQMLAARADGVVLTANQRIKSDRQAAAVIKDLVELGAPIIGVVA